MTDPLAGLPCVACAELELLCTVDIYDGPISGLVRHGGGMSWFAWLYDDEEPSPRRYSLHALPANDIPAAEAWAGRHNALRDELLVAANPHIYPVSARQRATMRSTERIEEDFAALADLPNAWAALPATAWFSEAGQAFAAIHTVTVPGLTAQALDAWQRRLAEALAAEDQAALDLLFADPPLPGDPLDIHWLTVAGRPVVRDWLGRPLPDDAVLTARHHVSNYDGILRRPHGS